MISVRNRILTAALAEMSEKIRDNVSYPIAIQTVTREPIPLGSGQAFEYPAIILLPRNEKIEVSNATQERFVWTWTLQGQLTAVDAADMQRKADPFLSTVKAFARLISGCDTALLSAEVPDAADIQLVIGDDGKSAICDVPLVVRYVVTKGSY